MNRGGQRFRPLPFLCLFKNPEEYDIITIAHILSVNGKNERL